ncbi:hypothetical protein PV11_00530 [Exophiala sideris]|uniref:Uncharacterized protein n=1 Tax=Exophiala sideris TaxID=1016849 RepID=A0A0D1YPN4_9EURO|nr:hypothetical protein PV11_00530 [Exophiala sideris]
MSTNTTGCVWNGYPYLAQAFKEGHMQADARLVVHDGVLRREISSVMLPNDTNMNPNQVRAWALSSNMIAGLYSSILADAWWKAILLPSPSLPLATQNLHFRAINGTQALVDSLLPLVRSQCIYGVIEDLAENASSTQQDFPVILTYTGNPDLTYRIQVQNMSSFKPTMRWIPIPAGPSPTNNDSVFLDHYPRAFAFIQVPAQRSNTSGITLACSVDTHWVPGTNTATGVAYDQTTITQTATLRQQDADTLLAWQWNKRSDSNTAPTFSPAPGWVPVLLAADWLDTLTPAMEDGSPGRSTLALALDELVNGADAEVDIESIAASFATLLATQIVDGMSRLGFSDNAGEPADPDAAWYNVMSTWDKNQANITDGVCHYMPDMLKRLITGKGNLVPRYGVDTGRMTKLIFSVIIQGYGYHANSTAYYLALTVLFVYVVLALSHTSYTLFRRSSSHAWGSFTEMLALCLVSNPPPVNVLKNTSGGIACHTTFRKRFMVRVSQVSSANITDPVEELQLVHDEDPAAQRMGVVVAGRVYGSMA